MRARLCFAVVVAFCWGCVTPPPRIAGFPDNRLGSYRYIEHVPTTSPPVTLEGTITVERDTLVIEPIGGLCRYDLNASQNRAIAYTCGDVGFSFERGDPITRNTFSFTTTVRTPVTKCVRYARNSAGQTVCAQTTQEVEERTQFHKGRLHPRRIG